MRNDAELAAIADEHGTPVLILERAVLEQRLALFKRLLPRVSPHYAVKACPHPEVVRTRHGAGAAFDIATSGEIDILRGCRVPPSATIHTHPIKRDVDIRAALRYGCTTFVVDNASEIDKFARYRERVGLLLRIRIDNERARIDLSRKFGCAPDAVPELIAYAASRQVHVKGLSFHVGSGNADPAAHVHAVRTLAATLEDCRGVTGARLTVLDIGGGFPVSHSLGAEDPLAAYCAPLAGVIAELPSRISVVAEPGRALVAPAMSSVNTVVGKAVRGGTPWYYLDDGVYGAFSGRVFDHAEFELLPLGEAARPGAAASPAVIAGPTCDSIDVVSDACPLPELEIGDRLLTRMIGAYSWATATEFNSIPRPKVVVID